MTDDAKDHLATIIDLLGPNLWLHVDDVHLRAAFGTDGTVEAAGKFAKDRGACFIPLSQPNRFASVGAFGRAYTKRDDT